jgi:polysaccharide pyruvyl transferase CsaB
MNKSKKSPAPKKTPKRRKNADNLTPHAIISGYYGFDNLGDELILKVLTDELKEKGVKITVLSNNPKKTAQQYGVQAIHRMNFIDIVDALAQANLFISGGGGLFQDATGPISPLYYGGLIHLANFFEVPICFWAQGVGPLRKEFSRKVTASALRHCDAIAVRDEQSAQLIRDISDLEPEVTADPVWLLKLPKPLSQPGKKNKKQSKPFRLGISLRPWSELTEARLKHLGGLLAKWADSFGQPVELLLLPFQKEEDTHLLSEFATSVQSLNLSIKMIEADQVLGTIKTCDAMLGMRFHSLILGLLAEIPIYGLIYDPKVDALLNMFDLQGCHINVLESLSPEQLHTAFTQAHDVDLKPYKKESRGNFKILNKLLNIPEAELVR